MSEKFLIKFILFFYFISGSYFNFYIRKECENKLYYIAPFLPVLTNIINIKCLRVIISGIYNSVVNYFTYAYLPKYIASITYSCIFAYTYYIPVKNFYKDIYYILFVFTFGFCFSIGMRYYSVFEMTLIQTLFWSLMDIHDT